MLNISFRKASRLDGVTSAAADQIIVAFNSILEKIIPLYSSKQNSSVAVEVEVALGKHGHDEEYYFSVDQRIGSSRASTEINNVIVPLLGTAAFDYGVLPSVTKRSVIVKQYQAVDDSMVVLKVNLSVNMPIYLNYQAPARLSELINYSTLGINPTIPANIIVVNYIAYLCHMHDMMDIKMRNLGS